jgi:large subunit ribosomal protein L15e
MGMYKYLREAWKQPDISAQRERYIQWRSESAYERIERPTRLDRARALGYKAKPGFVLVRACVKKGGRKRPNISSGRRPKRTGKYMTPGKSLQLTAEERTARKHPNLEVINSYWVGDDGKSVWYEVILANPSHPQIKADSDINWVCYRQHTRRVYRGLTSAGKKSRGLRKKGRGAEKVRPSLPAKKGRGN